MADGTVMTWWYVIRGCGGVVLWQKDSWGRDHRQKGPWWHGVVADGALLASAIRGGPLDDIVSW